jgi:hypothetical protein
MSRGNDANYQRSSLNRGGDRGDHNEWNHDKYYENYNKSAARERDRSRSRSRSRERSSESYGFRGHQDQRPQKVNTYTNFCDYICLIDMQAK